MNPGTKTRILKLVLIGIVLFSTLSIRSLAETKNFAIDCGTEDGPIDIVLGIEGNPHRWTHAFGVVDMTEKMHDLMITHCRTQEEGHSHPASFAGVFPDWRAEWWAGSDDPFQDPENYNFDNSKHTTPIPETYTYHYVHSTDYHINDIIGNGFQPLFKLGLSVDKFNWWHRFHHLGYTFFPNPIPDTDSARRKVAIVAENILRHYNEGWHNGFEYGIEFWEVWNEPDIDEMWAGTPLAFRKLYREIATRFRGTRSEPIRPDVKIGPAALAWTVPPTGYHVDLSRGFCEDLLQYCNSLNVPVDFYSWHHYGGLQAMSAPDTLSIWFGGNSWVYLNAARRIRQALDNNGYSHALSICDEWNSLVNQNNPYHNTDLAAAFTACGLMYMDYADVHMAAYFPCVNEWGLWDALTEYTREAYAYQAFSLLRNETPRRLKVTNGLVMNVGAGTADNFAIMAGRSQDGERIQILLADEDQKYIIAPGQTHWLRYSAGYWASNAIQDPSRLSYSNVSVRLENLPPRTHYSVTYRTIDTNGTWIESDPEEHTSTAGGEIILELEWSPPAVCLITMEYTGEEPPASAGWIYFQ